MSSRWVALMQGSIPEVITLQASCESIGIPTWVPDMNLIQADPFIRGGNALALQLFVPEDRLADALSFKEGVEEVRAAHVARRDADGGALARLETLGKRVRWCSVLGVTAPFGIWLGVRYLREAHASPVRPTNHAHTVVAFWVSILMTLVLVAAYSIMYLR
jgi:hypothetical protein